jgi:choice-of-anchor C domain-containing protein
MKPGIAIVLPLVFSTAAWCAPFQNGDFEIGASACNVYNIPAGTNLGTGWTVSVGNIDWESNPGCDGWSPSSGSHSLDLVGDVQGIGGVQQTFDTVPGVTYLVSFDLAGNYGGLPVVKPLTVTINGTPTSFTFDTTGKSALNMGWTTKTVLFTAASGSSTISFVSDIRGLGSVNAGAALDNVRITVQSQPGGSAAVPLDWAHVGAALLIVLAGAGLFWRYNRRAG